MPKEPPVLSDQEVIEEQSQPADRKGEDTQQGASPNGLST